MNEEKLNRLLQRNAELEQQLAAKDRELQIGAALERVRVRTMAMQRSDELAEVAELLFKEVKALGIQTWTTGFNVWREDGNGYEDWITNPQGGFIEPYSIVSTVYAVFRQVSEAKKRGESFYVQSEEGETLKETYRWLSKFAANKQFENILESGFQFPERQYDHFVFGAKVSLMFITYEPVPEAHDIFKRFGRVFEQTYTRFLDLQKAEAHAWEVQIQLGLERVNARAMAMQHSDELAEAAKLLYDELRSLGINPVSCGYMFIEEAHQTQTAWVTLPDGTLLPDYIVFPLTGDAILDDRYRVWREKEALHKAIIQGEANKEHHRFLSSKVPANFSAAIFEHIPANIVFYSANFSAGYLMIIATDLFSAEEEQTIVRFAKVFETTYTRFLDLQRAEAQARAARIEASLERVRSKAMAMQKSDDLANAVATVFEELDNLEFGMLRCGIGIINKENRSVNVWASTKSDKDMPLQLSGDEPMDAHPLLRGAFDAWLNQEEYSYTLEGDDLRNYYRTQVAVNFKLPASQSLVAGEESTRQFYYLATFPAGGLFAFRETPFPEEAKAVMQRFAAVFTLTYTRYHDLQVAEAHALQAKEDFRNLQAEKMRAEAALAGLKAMQAQLIQQEKMASLGELTAGIAHEIQNPLNFVNNFSAVNKELVEEIEEELEKANIEEAKALAKDIKENEEKIAHHGKRADSIVKGMLQHARASTGDKHPTDINRLADEYLRLSYQGMRAKDKAFNAIIETRYDANVGNINLVPQDIGRVLLNLYNNAFYAVHQKKNQLNGTFEPVVSVSTKREGEQVIVSVSDNGTGIPEQALGKIFQPFFTTKPTGEGTGLGLSLSYDTVTKGHGGTIVVESKQGEGSVFTIRLPLTAAV